MISVKLPLKVTLPLLLALVAISILIATGFGTANLTATDTIQCLLSECDNKLTQTIIFDIRLPRVLLGFTAGFALASAGALMQNVTRNPLADPYLFGIIAGAGLGATVATMASDYLPVALQSLTLPVFAFIGAMLAIVLVMGVLVNQRWRKVEFLLLAGIAISFLLSAVTHLLLYFGDAFAANRIIFWLMGSLARADYQALTWTAPVVLVCCFIALIFSRQLDALLISDESARTLGVNVERLRLIALILSAAMVAVIVSYCGGIAFVGLMIPHIVRPFFGLTTARLLISSGLVGGCFLIWVDVLARSSLEGQEIPLGVITSVMGSLFFLMIMRRAR